MTNTPYILSSCYELNVSAVDLCCLICWCDTVANGALNKLFYFYQNSLENVVIPLLLLH